MAGWICPGCNILKSPGTDCENCGKSDPTIPAQGEIIGGDHRRDQVMRDTLTEDQLDEMIAQASMPTLAQLFKRGKDSGLIKPSDTYSGPPA
jgi:hypothetical protein